MTNLRDAVRDAYGGAGATWAAGPAAIYRRMAAALIEAAPVGLAGQLVLDFGAGTGATSDAVDAAGAVVIAADLSADMLAIDHRRRPPASCADVRALPFRANVFDAAMGAFVISHLADPVNGLREAARVTRAGGVVMTLGFDGRWSFSAKELVEETLRAVGFERPNWYEEMKTKAEPLSAFPDRLAALAREAGLADISVHETAVDVGVTSAAGIVGWRLSLPMYASFVAELDPEVRDGLLAELADALGPNPEPLVPELLVLCARVPS